MFYSESRSVKILSIIPSSDLIILIQLPPWGHCLVELHHTEERTEAKKILTILVFMLGNGKGHQLHCSISHFSDPSGDKAQQHILKT